MKRAQRGFTIIELMIATTIFSLVLMLCLAGILQITKMYYRGVTLARTQEKARTVVDEIAESIRYTSAGSNIVVQSVSAPIDPLVVGPEVAAGASDDTNYLCVGSKRYTYAIDRILKASPSASASDKHKKHVLWIDTISGACDAPADLTQDAPSATGQELLSENMRLMRFEVSAGVVSGTFNVYVGVGYGDNELLYNLTSDGLYKTCEGEFVGAEFCATSSISLTVEKRIE
ncbi:prepilin-type N-terminal cleavage/methylation domain-containing protein [Candidatus Saccharibacteria bacterium]|nr:prepilin-type N-terminal cleavage/methylation domain-containing protein [Candidatus Saccharibacteria bacterium]